MNTNLEAILKFIDLLHQFRKVERVVLSNGTDRKENDVEHSYNLAMVGWYINESENLGLNNEKILKYSLAHDLVEVFAGDTYFVGNEDHLSTKQQREKEAADKIKEKFPEFPEMHKIIEEYEKMTDKESKFVYALDKVEPVLNIYLDEGRSWRKHNVTYEMLATKSPKVAVDSTIEALFADLMERLRNDKKNFPETY